jgi:hypothetical protein
MEFLRKAPARCQSPLFSSIAPHPAEIPSCNANVWPHTLSCKACSVLNSERFCPAVVKIPVRPKHDKCTN